MTLLQDGNNLGNRDTRSNQKHQQMVEQISYLAGQRRPTSTHRINDGFDGLLPYFLSNFGNSAIK